MTLKYTDIERLAMLSRLAVNETDYSAVCARLESVLALVDQLQAADTAGVQPMAHPLNASQSLRADRITEFNQQQAFEILSDNTHEGLYLVPKVID